MTKVVMMEKPLRDKLGEEASQSLIRLINEHEVAKKQDMLEFVEEKFERRLSEEIGKVNLSIAQVEQRLDNRITEEIAKVNVNIAGVERNMIRWMFIFWIGQVGALVGILFAFSNNFSYKLNYL